MVKNRSHGRLTAETHPGTTVTLRLFLLDVQRGSWSWRRRSWPASEATRPPIESRLHFALTFWDGWVDARNNGRPPGPVVVADWPELAGVGRSWPELAERLADDLAADREITDPVAMARFDLVRHPGLNERVHTLAARLRARE